jgi:hypothetical protein
MPATPHRASLDHPGGRDHLARSGSDDHPGRTQPADQPYHDTLPYGFGQATPFIMLAADLGISSGHPAVTDQQQRSGC